MTLTTGFTIKNQKVIKKKNKTKMCTYCKNPIMIEDDIYYFGFIPHCKICGEKLEDEQKKAKEKNYGKL